MEELKVKVDMLQTDILETKNELKQFLNESKEYRLEMNNVVKDLTHTIHEVKEDMDSFRESTKSLIETFQALQGLVNVLLWIGKIMKPLTVVAIAITGIVLYFQGLKFPGGK